MSAFASAASAKEVDANLEAKSGVGVSDCASDSKHHDGLNSSAACNARPGDLLNVALNELHPTQTVLGYDEVYYKLGRYLSGNDVKNGSFNKRFDDWCEANGQEKAKSADANSRLDDSTSFSCTVELGSETEATTGVMKTAVVGPKGQLYLTDGHHTFTSFWESEDGGPDTHVRVRITANYSHLDKETFWKTMKANNGVWLFDENNQPIQVK